jgi:hypothetical protein
VCVYTRDRDNNCQNRRKTSEELEVELADHSAAADVETEMRHALLQLAVAGQKELVHQQRLPAVTYVVAAGEGLDDLLALGGGPMQRLAAVDSVVHLRRAVPVVVAAVAGALAVAQVLRHIQHAAVVHEPAAGRVLVAGVVAVRCRVEAAAEAVGKRERVEHLLLLHRSCAVSGGRGLLFLVFRHRRAGGDGLVSAGVDAELPQLLLEAAVPEVLDLVVRPARQVRRDLRPPGENAKFVRFDAF